MTVIVLLGQHFITPEIVGMGRQIGRFTRDGTHPPQVLSLGRGTELFRVWRF